MDFIDDNTGTGTGANTGTATISLDEYKKLLEAKNALYILLNSYGTYGVDNDTLHAVAKTIGFALSAEE